MKIDLAVVVISTILAILAGILPDLAQTEAFYQNLTWFFMLAIMILAAASLVSAVAAFDLRQICRRHWPAGILAMLLVAGAALVSPPDFRILADETNLLGVSLEMHENLKTRLPLEALYYYQGLRDGITFKTEMRPAGYPFALSLLHGLVGYRVANPFALNLLLAWVALILLYLLVQKHAGKIYGIVAMLLLAAFPAFVQSVCSAGFEIYNLALGLALLIAVECFADRRVGAGVVIALLLLLAYSRYESILGVVCFLPFILYYRSDADSGLSGRAIWSFPLLLVPALWLRRLTFDTGSFQVKNIEDAFSVANFLPNLSGWIEYFTSIEYCRFIGPMLLAVFPVGLILWLVSLSDAAKICQRRILEIATGLFFALHLVARLFYTQGNPVNPYTSRLVVMLLPALIILFLHALAGISRWKNPVGQKSIVAVGFAFLLLITSWPAVSGIRVTNWIALFREFKWVRQELLRLNAGEESILVCARPTMYIPLRYSAVGAKYLVEKAGKVKEMLELAAYNRLILIESINYKSGRSNMPTVPAELASLKTEIVFETQLTGAEKLRITTLTTR